MVVTLQAATIWSKKVLDSQGSSQWLNTISCGQVPFHSKTSSGFVTWYFVNNA